MVDFVATTRPPGQKRCRRALRLPCVPFAFYNKGALQNACSAPLLSFVIDLGSAGAGLPPYSFKAPHRRFPQAAVPTRPAPGCIPGTAFAFPRADHPVPPRGAGPDCCTAEEATDNFRPLPPGTECVRIASVPFLPLDRPPFLLYSIFDI